MTKGGSHLKSRYKHFKPTVRLTQSAQLYPELWEKFLCLKESALPLTLYLQSNIFNDQSHICPTSSGNNITLKLEL